MNAKRDDRPEGLPMPTKSATSGTFVAVRPSRPSSEPEVTEADLTPDRIEAQIANCRQMVAAMRERMADLGRERLDEITAIAKTRPVLVPGPARERLGQLGAEIEDIAESIRRSRKVIDAVGEDLVNLHADSVVPDEPK